MRELIQLITAFLLITFGPTVAVAHDATPAASGSLLAEQGFPEISMTADDNGLTNAPSDVDAGRYLITLINDSPDAGELDLVQVADTSSYDDTAALYVEATVGGGFPDEVYETPIAGGVAVEGNSTAQVILDLRPSQWVFGFSSYPEDGPEMARTVKVNVSGTFPKVDEPATDVTVGMFEMGFDMPDQLDAGPSILELTNTGAQPHFLEIGRYPTAFDEDEFLSALTSVETDGTPDPNLDFDISQLELVYDSSLLTAGMTNWLQLDLEPGFYVALSFMPDQETGEVDALLGMYHLFEVQ